MDLTLCHRSIRSVFDSAGPSVKTAPLSLISSAACRPPPRYRRRTNQVHPLRDPLTPCCDYMPRSSSTLRPFTGTFLKRARKLLSYTLTSFPASSSAHTRDAPIAIRDIASAAPYNRGMSGSALRAGAVLGPDVSPAVTRAARDEPAAAVPLTRVDQMVARLGTGLATGSAVFASPSFTRSFAGGGRAAAASNRPPEDSLPVSALPTAAASDSLILVESLSQAGVFTCHRFARRVRDVGDS
jgi:hypothetical protein